MVKQELAIGYVVRNKQGEFLTMVWWEHTPEVRFAKVDINEAFMYHNLEELYREIHEYRSGLDILAVSKQITYQKFQER